MLVITTATYIVGTSSTITTAPVAPVPKFSSTCFFCRMARARSPFYLPFHRSGLRRSALRLICPLLTSPPRSRTLPCAQSKNSDTSETSRGKTDRLRRTPAGFTTPGP